MEQDFIIVSDIYLCSAIRDELTRLGIQRKYTGVTDYKKFTKEELASIKRLKLENNAYEDISALEYCTGLKQLTIQSQNSKQASTNFSAEAFYNYQSKQSAIKDFSVISKLKSLQFLTIIDDPTLTSLDLTGLTQLASLELSGNHSLTEVKGLETLTDLSELTMINNAISSSFDLKKILDEGVLSYINLDFDLYPIIRKNYPDIDEDMYKRVNQGTVSKCSWSENLSDLRFNTINTHFMEQMDTKAREIISTSIGPNYSDIEKIAAIYAYIIQNVTYDTQARKARTDEEARKEFAQQRGNMSELTKTTLDRQQSSYNAILEERAVCEGYTNMMHYLLKSIGIDSMTVHCSADLGEKLVGSNSNHSVIKVVLDGETYYFDPTWDAKKTKIGNFLKTKEEFSTNHVLSITENGISSPSQKPFTNEQLSQIFGKVLADRNIGRNQIQNAVKGMESESQDKTPQEWLQEYNQKLKYLQEQYGLIATQIEQLMQQNSQKPVANYQYRLNQLTEKRDMVSDEMSPIIESQRVWQKSVEDEKQREHQATISQVEKLLGIHIDPVAEFVYDNELKVPRRILKDTASLAREHGQINRKLEQLFYDGEIDIKTYNKMKMEIIHEFDDMKKRAPKPSPATPPSKDDDEFFQRQEQNPTPVPQPYRQEVKHQTEKKEVEHKSPTTSHQHTEKSQDRKKLEEERRDLRRKQFEERAKAMGIDTSKVANLDEIFRQQQMIEQQRLMQEQEEIEEIEHHGMSM